MFVLASRLGHTFVALCILVLSFAAPLASQNTDRPLYLKDSGLPTLAPLLAKVTPAVVNSSVETRQAAELNPLFNDPFLRRFFDMEPMPQQPQQRGQMSTGVGVIIDAPEGYALTNHHVVENGDRIVATFKDGHRIDADLVDRDPRTVSAMLKTKAKAVIDQLIEFGEVKRRGLGVRIQDFTPDLAEAFGMEGGVGAVISHVVPGSAAEAAGLQPGDLIVSVDGRPVAGSADLRLKRLGRAIKISVIRDGEALALKVKLRQGGQLGDRLGDRGLGRLSGADLRDLQPGHPLYGDASGVLIAQVDSDSRAARSGLEAGDFIVAVNRVPVGSVTELRQQIASIDGALALTIQRGSVRMLIIIR